MAPKKRATKLAEVAEPRYSITEMAAVLHTIPELQESFSRADLELALDDRGWMNLTGSGLLNSGTEVDHTTRLTQITKSRLYWKLDPLAKQAVRLWTDYALGNGITYKCEDEGVQAKLDEFCRHRRNRKLMKSEGQRRTSKKLLIDGDMFFAVFMPKEEGGVKVVRRLDATQITHIMCDPDDDETTLVYRRAKASGDPLYYLDWACDEEEKVAAAKLRDPETKKAITLQENVVVLHVSFDSIGKFGNGVLNAALNWSVAHRRFMEARVAITQALSKFAWRMTVKGGPSMVAAIKKQLQSTHASSGAHSVERNPPPAAASTAISNDGAKLDAMPRTTGAGDAETDSNGLKLMVCAATGIMLHYFGDPSTGNLATATAMELPMLKMFESFQQLWKDAYRDLFAIVLDEDMDAEGATIDIDLPPILQADLQKLADVVAKLIQAFPEAKVPDLLQHVLQQLGLNNLDEIMKAVAAQKEKVEKEQAEMKKAELAVMKTQATPQAAAKLKESQDNLAAALVQVAKVLED